MVIILKGKDYEWKFLVLIYPTGTETIQQWLSNLMLTSNASSRQASFPSFTARPNFLHPGFSYNISIPRGLHRFHIEYQFDYASHTIWPIWAFPPLTPVLITALMLILYSYSSTFQAGLVLCTSWEQHVYGGAEVKGENETGVGQAKAFTIWMKCHQNKCFPKLQCLSELYLILWRSFKSRRLFQEQEFFVNMTGTEWS